MKKNGFTLLEVVFGIFILTLSAFASSNLIQSTIVSTTLNKQKLTAYYMAQEGIEVVRNQRDSNWLEQRAEPGVSWTDDILSETNLRIVSPCDFYGDVNFDGIISEADSDIIRNDLPGEDDGTEAWKRGDLNGDNNITNPDSVILNQYLGYIGESFPICDESKFQREVETREVDESTLEVTSRVTWSEKGSTQEVEVISNLTNWK